MADPLNALTLARMMHQLSPVVPPSSALTGLGFSATSTRSPAVPLGVPTARGAGHTPGQRGALRPFLRQPMHNPDSNVKDKA